MVRVVYAVKRGCRKTYDFSAENALKVTVLQEIAPEIKLPEGTTGVTLADTFEKDDTDHSKAVTEAEKIEFAVTSGADGVTLTKDTDYTVKCEWQNGADGAAGKITATLELTDAAKAKYALSNEAAITVDVPVTYKQEEQAKAVTFTVEAVTFDGKLDAEPTADEIKQKLKLTFHAGNETVTLNENDYTVDIKKLTVAAAAEAPVGDYTITVTAPTNGTVTPNKVTANEGDEITLTVTPDSGYKLDTLTVKDADGTAVTVSADHKFTMPAKAVTVSATFVEDGAATETTYRVTVTKPTNGTVTADKTTAKKGDTVILTVTPAGSSYTLNKLTVTDKDGKAVTVSNSRFTMPESDVTVTATFKRKSSSGSSSGSSRPTSGSTSSSSAPYTSNLEISSLIGSSKTGDTVKVEGNIYILSDVVKAAANKNVALEVKIDDTFTWNIDVNKLATADDALRLTADLTAVNRTETAKIERSAGVADNVEMSFSTIANNLGTGATLTVKTSARPTAAYPQFANLYKTNADGTLEFVAAAPVGADGSTVLPIGTAGTYTVVTPGETKKPGDINNDCKVDLTDLTAALSKFVNSTNLTRSDDFKMDHDGNSVCTLSDITLMLKDYVNGKLK